MAKVLEGPGMGLMKKWGINVPNYVVITSVEELTKLGEANEWLKKTKLVVKAHEALGSRFKLGWSRWIWISKALKRPQKKCSVVRSAASRCRRSLCRRWFRIRKNITAQ